MSVNEVSKNDLVEENDIILSISWEKGILACCYYKLETMELFTTYEAPDPAPDYSFLSNMLRQINPNYVIASGPYFFLKDLMRKYDLPEEAEPQEYKINKTGSVSLSNFLIFSNDEKNLERNRQRILSLCLPGMCENFTKEERSLFIESVLPLHQNLVVQCMGNLLNYLDTTWRIIFQKDNNNPMLTDLKVFFLQSQVLVDDCTLGSLQIFSNRHHPSAFKKDCVEGFSVFNVFNRCCSKVGSKALQILMSQPLRNIRELNRSFETIQWCIQEKDTLRLQTIKKFIKKIHDIGVIFKNINLRPNKAKDWLLFKETVQSSLLLVNFCRDISSKNVTDTLISDIANAIDDQTILKNILFTIDKIIDLEESLNQEKFIVKANFDEELDEKKLQMMMIQDSLQDQVQTESRNLPNFVSQLFGYYVPEMGYVIKILISDHDPPIAQLENDNLTFLIQNEDAYFFKSSLCEELNKKYGHIYPEICEHESRICDRLLKYLRENLPFIQKIVKLCAKLDYMMAFAIVATEQALVRPEIVTDKVIKIIKGRHLLWEMKTQFIPNDTDISLTNKNLITILTAPNASGKSVYMKQVGLIVFLCHIGSFVPASYAKICLLNSIYSRMHMPESTYVGSSSFLLDLQQMGRVMTNSTDRSLILIDEFGKGTSELEGQALLASCIEDLALRQNECPFVFITTHYTNVFDLLDVRENVVLLTFENKNNNSGALVSTFKLKNGRNVERYADKIDGVKQFLEELFHKYCNSKVQLEDLHSLKIKFAFNAVREYAENGSVDVEFIKKSMEDLQVIDAESDAKN